MPLRTTREDEIGRDGPDSDKRYDGEYLGFVRDSGDPEQRGRVRIYCPEVMGEVDSADTWLDWAETSHFMTGFDQGFMAVPPDPSWKTRDSGGESSPYNQTRVWVTFRNGDSARPVYRATGSWYGENQLPHHAPKLITADSGGDETTGLPNYLTSTTRYTPLRPGDLADAEQGASAGDLVDSGDVGEPRPQTTAQYPFNHVYKSPSGLVVEMDNTPGGRRFRLYHPAGSSVEINDAGTWAQKVQGKESVFIVEDSTRVVKGAQTLIVEGTSHSQYDSSHTAVYRDSRIEVVERTYESFFKSGWYREVGGRLTTLCADYLVESVGTATIAAGGGVGIAADEVSIGGQTVEVAGTDTAVKGQTGVKISTEQTSSATHPLYASLDIDTDLEIPDAQIDAMTSALEAVLTPIPPGTGANPAGVTYAIQTLASAVQTIIAALKKNKTDHLAGPANPTLGVDFPDFPDVPAT